MSRFTIHCVDSLHVRFPLRERLKLLFGAQVNIRYEIVVTREESQTHATVWVDECEEHEIVSEIKAPSFYQEPPVLLWSSMKE